MIFVQWFFGICKRDCSSVNPRPALCSSQPFYTHSFTKSSYPCSLNIICSHKNGKFRTLPAFHSILSNQPLSLKNDLALACFCRSHLSNSAATILAISCYASLYSHCRKKGSLFSKTGLKLLYYKASNQFLASILLRYLRENRPLVRKNLWLIQLTKVFFLLELFSF